MLKVWLPTHDVGKDLAEHFECCPIKIEITDSQIYFKAMGTLGSDSAFWLEFLRLLKRYNDIITSWHLNNTHMRTMPARQICAFHEW